MIPADGDKNFDVWSNKKSVLVIINFGSIMQSFKDLILASSVTDAEIKKNQEIY